MLKYLYLDLSYAEEDTNYILNGPLAGSFYFTKTKPGNKESVVQSHSPLLEINILSSTVVSPFRSTVIVEPETTNEPVIEESPSLLPSHS